SFRPSKSSRACFRDRLLWRQKTALSLVRPIVLVPGASVKICSPGSPGFITSENTTGSSLPRGQLRVGSSGDFASVVVDRQPLDEDTARVSEKSRKTNQEVTVNSCRWVAPASIRASRSASFKSESTTASACRKCASSTRTARCWVYSQHTKRFGARRNRD